MHIEKKCKWQCTQASIGEKDTLNIRRDMEEVGIRPWLWLQWRGPNFVKPIAPYVFSTNETQ
jgi:hypothetical protein